MHTHNFTSIYICGDICLQIPESAFIYRYIYVVAIHTYYPHTTVQSFIAKLCVQTTYENQKHVNQKIFAPTENSEYSFDDCNECVRSLWVHNTPANTHKHRVCGNICRSVAAIRLFRLPNKPPTRANCVCCCCCAFPLPLQRNRIISATLELLSFISTTLVVLSSFHTVSSSPLCFAPHTVYSHYSRRRWLLPLRHVACVHFYLVYAVVHSQYCAPTSLLVHWRSLACLHFVLCIFFVWYSVACAYLATAAFCADTEQIACKPTKPFNQIVRPIDCMYVCLFIRSSDCYQGYSALVGEFSFLFQHSRSITEL